MKKLTTPISALIASVIILVIGILCIVAGAASGEASASAFEGISMTIGITLIVVSSIVLLVALIGTIMSKGLVEFGKAAIGISVTLALGIFFVANTGLGGELILLLLGFVPYVLIVVGSIIIVDAILSLVFAGIRKEINAVAATSIIAIVIGAISVLLGALMIGNDPVISKSSQLVIFGIIVIVYALAICAIASLALVYNKKQNKEEKKDSIDAEVKEVNEAKEEPKAE
jgi:hypothetical protein